MSGWRKGHTDMRKGFGSLALLVQESLKGAKLPLERIGCPLIKLTGEGRSAMVTTDGQKECAR